MIPKWQLRYLRIPKDAKDWKSVPKRSLWKRRNPAVATAPGEGFCVFHQQFGTSDDPIAPPPIGSIPFIRFLIRHWNLLDSLFSWLHLLTHIELIWIHEFNIHVYNHLDPLKSIIASHSSPNFSCWHEFEKTQHFYGLGPHVSHQLLTSNMISPCYPDVIHIFIYPTIIIFPVIVGSTSISDGSYTSTINSMKSLISIYLSI